MVRSGAVIKRSYGMASFNRFAGVVGVPKEGSNPQDHMIVRVEAGCVYHIPPLRHRFAGAERFELSGPV